MGHRVHSTVTRTLLVLLVLTFLSPGSVTTSAIPISPGKWSMPGISMSLKSGDQVVSLPAAQPEASSPQAVKGVSFDISYVGAWSPAAQNAVQYAANVWATRINSTVPIKVVAEWKPLGQNILVTGGPTQVLINFAGAPVPNAWYPVALANRCAGLDLAPDMPDINVAINSAYDWYLGTDGQTPSNQVDLVTSSLAGLTFGLGFFSSMGMSSNQGSWGWSTGSPYVFDHFVVNGYGQALVDTNLFPNPSGALAAQLTSNNIFFSGSNARGANGGANPRMYAPGTWEPGLSISHLDENAFPRGNPNSLMTPYLDFGEAIHDPGPITIGIFRDIGWSTDVVPPAPITEGRLELQMLDAVPINVPIRPYVTVFNDAAAPANYTLLIRLGKGFATLAEQTRNVAFAWSGQQTLVFDFGGYGPGGYYVTAELRQGTKLIDYQTHAFAVGLDYLRLQSNAKELTNAAYTELNEGQDIAADALAQAALSGTSEAVDWLVGKLASVMTEVAYGIAELDLHDVEVAVGEIVSRWLAFGKAVELHNYDAGYNMFHDAMDRNTFNARRESVRSANASLLDYGLSRTFTWNSAWEAEVARRREAISNKNETVGGLSLALDGEPPFVHRASLVEMKGQFSWIHDSLLPALDRVSWFLLIVFIAALAIIGIILVLPTASVPPALLAVAVIVGKFMLTAYPIILNLLVSSTTTKLLVALIVLTMCAVSIGAAAEGIVSPAVVTEHQDGMDYLRQQISGGLSSDAVPDLTLSASVRGHEVGVSARLGQGQASTWLETQLFRADGQLMDIVDYGLAKPGAKTSLVGKLPAGSYWAVGVAHGKDTTRSQFVPFRVTTAAVALNVTLSDTHLNLGDTLQATVTLTNLDPNVGTGTLVLSVKTVDGEGLQMWMLALGPNQVVSYPYTFTPNHMGGYVLRATVSDDMDVIARADRTFVVGDAPAVALELAPRTVYSAGETIIWDITARNGGTLPANVTLTLDTLDRNANYAPVFNTSQALSLAAGSSAALHLTALPNAMPGAFVTRVALNDQQYLVQDFLVQAQGTLFTMVRAEPVVASLNQSVLLGVEVQDQTYVPTDANAALSIRTPDGRVVNIPLTWTSTGRYQGSFTPDIAGTYSVEASASKPYYVSVSNSTFFIADTASALIVDVKGEATLNVQTTLSFAVQNERQLPVLGARVILSSAQGVQSIETDENGKANLLLKPASTGIIKITAEKPGYASPQLQLMVYSKVSLPILLRSGTDEP